MIKIIRSQILDLPVNLSLSYLWCNGFMISFFLVVQTLSGILLSFYYSSDSNVTFYKVLEFTQENFYCWLVRYTHIWGVNFIFFLMYMHMGRSLYYGSYRKIATWNVGFILYLCMMAEAFLGYILPWHQMSYWAATVITSIIQSIPLVGNAIFKYTVGGLSVTGSTLPRVFAAHIILAFVIIGLSFLHLFYLHRDGSNNPLTASESYSDFVLFRSYFICKDVYALSVLLFFFFGFMLVSPDLLLSVESYIEANPMVTPPTIKPEWYFLAFYAMLRSVESKVGGMLVVLAFMVILWVPTPTRPSPFVYVRQFCFWSSVSFFVILTYLGSCHPEYCYIAFSKFISFCLLLSLAYFKWSWYDTTDPWAAYVHAMWCL